MSKAKKVMLGAVIIIVVLYAAVINIVAPKYIEAVLPSIENLSTDYINGKIKIQDIKISSGLTITAEDISVTNKTGDKIAEVPSVVVGINPLKGVAGRDALSAVSSIDVNNPVISIAMDKKDKWNITGLLKEVKEKNTAFKGMIHINNGHLLVTTPYGNWNGGIQGDVDAAADPVYALNLEMHLGNETITLDGKIDSDMVGNMRVKTASFGVSDFTTLLSHYLPIQNTTGAVKDLDLAWKNDGKNISMEGAGAFKQLTSTVVAEGYHIPITADGQIKFDKMKITAKNLQAAVNGEQCRVDGSLDFTDMKNPTAEELTVDLQNFNPNMAEKTIPVSGELNGRLVFNGNKDNINLAGNLQAPLLKVEDYELANVEVDVASTGNKLILQRAMADFGGGKVVVAGEYEQHTKEVVAGIETHNVNFANVNNSFGNTLIADGVMYLAGSLDTGHLRLSTVGDIMTLKWQNLLLKNLMIDADISKNNVVLNNFSGATGDGGILLASGKMTNSVLDASASVVRLPIDSLLSYFGQTGSGLLSGSFKVTGTTANPNVAGRFSLEKGNVAGQEINEAHGFAGWENHVLSFKKVEAYMKQGSHKLNGTINMQSDDPVFDLQIDTENVRIEPLAALAGSPFPITGNLTNNMHLTGPMSNPEFSGNVHAWYGSVHGFLVDDVKGDYSLNGGNLALKNFFIHTLTSVIKMDGTMDAQGNLDFGIEAKDVHLGRMTIINKYAEFGGAFDFSGSVKGTRHNPLFNGVVTSNSISVNKVEFTGLACKLHSEGGTVNNLNGTFQQKAGGDYAVDLLVDFSQHLVQGNVDVQNGDVKSLLKIGKQDLDIQGALTGRIELNKAGRGTGLTMKGQIDNGEIRGIQFKSADFDVFANAGLWHIITLKAIENDGGVLLAQGTLDTKKRTIDMELGCNKANAKLLTTFMTHPLELEGSMDVAAQLNGNLDNPKGNLSLQIDNGAVSGVAFDSLYGMVTLRDDIFKMEQLLLQKGIYKVSAYGSFPQDLLRRVGERRNPNAKMDLEVKLDNANLAILPSLTKWVEWSDGDTKGGVKITGTLEDYNMDGAIDVTGGTIKMKHVDTTLDNILIKILFKGKQISLEKLNSTVGKKGTIAAHGNFALTDEDEAPYLLDFMAKDVEIKSPVFTGKINAHAEVEQKRNRPQVTAKVKVDDAKINISSIPDVGEGDSNVGLHVDFELGPKIHLYNRFLYNMWLAGNLKVRGSTRYPRIDGAIKATKGTISYLSTPFNIQEAEVTWPMAGTFIPHVKFAAVTKFGRYNITAKANGPVTAETLHISLTSEPPASESMIMKMLTLKTDLLDSSDNDYSGLLEAGLQMTFLGDVEDFIKRALTLDDFRIYSGSTRSGLGFDIDSLKANDSSQEERNKYNVLVSKYLTKHILVGYTTSFDQQYHSVFAEYNIGPKLNLDFSINEKQEKWYGIMYRTSF